MAAPVVNSALLQCSFGVAPSTMTVAPLNRVTFEGKPVANIMDNKPFLNIMPFGVCNSLSNPSTASLTAAALGVLTPGPCAPVIPAPWAPGATTTMIAGQPALTDSSMCNCAYGGVIQVNVGQAFRETVT